MVVNFSSIVRYYSSNTNRSFYVTTPIFYVNAAPHIGHLYSAVIADAVYRYQKIKNPNRLYKFSTGTDEHGIKIQQAAAINKIPINEYCEKISKEYENVFKLAGIQYTDFIRTSDERHKNTVKQFWNKLKTNDCIYSSTYSGWYCVSDETFLTDNQLKLNSNGKKVSSESGHPVEWTDEQNYLFKLSKFQSDIIEWIKEGNHIKPKKFEKILLDYLLNEPLNDLSISRPTTRVKWGIKVPDDDTQTIYVWLDALVNYLTCSNLYLSSDTDSKDRKFWPPTLQIIGKDILKFHGIYWPAFLIAAGLELPECLLVHSHWTVDGEKMSKSKFNVIDPIDRSSLYTMEGLRYFLLREGVAHSDGNYSDTKILRILNSELADTLGNLLSRCCAKTLNPRQIYPKIHLKQFKDIIEMDVTKNLMESLNQLPEKCEKHYDDCNFYMVVDQVMKTLHIANNFFETTKPWELIKNYKKQIIAKKINVKEVPLINNENEIDKFSTDASGGIKNKKSVSLDIKTAVATSTSSAAATLAISATKTATSTSTMATATVIEHDDDDDVNGYREIEDNIHQLETIICIVMDTLRICAIILQPIIPDICQKLLDKLNIPHTERYWEKLKFSQQQQPQQQQMLENIASDILSNNCNAYINYLCCNHIENEKNLGTTDSVLFRRIIMEQNKSSRIEKTNDKKLKTQRK